MDFARELNQQVRELGPKRSLAIESLAHQIGVRVPTVYNWLNGKTKVRRGLVDKVNRITGIRKSVIRPDLFCPICF